MFQLQSGFLSLNFATCHSQGDILAHSHAYKLIYYSRLDIFLVIVHSQKENLHHHEEEAVEVGAEEGVEENWPPVPVGE